MKRDNCFDVKITSNRDGVEVAKRIFRVVFDAADALSICPLPTFSETNFCVATGMASWVSVPKTPIQKKSRDIFPTSA
jgi:hypothetical protein